MKSLTTHNFSITDATKAYDLVSGKRKEFTVGIILNYGQGDDADNNIEKTVVRKKTTGKIGLGFIGAGNFVKSTLVPSIINTGGFDILGVVSAMGLSADSIKKNIGANFSATDVLTIFDNKEVDAVIIATRHDSHGKYVLEALKRGKHVFVEKPLCLNRDELAQIEVAAKESEGILMVGYNRRFSPFVMRIAEFFKDRSEPLSMIYRVNAGRITMDDPLAWVQDLKIGGGRIIGEACHFIDTMQFITDSSAVDLQVSGINPNRSNLVSNDIVTITIGFEDGSMGTLHYFSNGDTSMNKERLEVFCQERIAVLDNYKTLDLISAGKTVRKTSRNIDKGFKEEAEVFLQACRSGVPPVAVSSLIETMLVTLLAEDDLHGVLSDPSVQIK